MNGLISLSGGMDSTTLLAHLRAEGHEMQAVMFTYGSKHNQFEMRAVLQVAKHYGTIVTFLDLSSIFRYVESDLLLSGGEIPEGHYEQSNMTRTVVPGRNLIFASIAASIAESRNLQFVALGVHAGDHAIYPDCRPEFIRSVRATISHSTEERVGVGAPFLHITKEDILRRGVQLNVPYELTRTCYKAQETACGRCGSCQERLEAFRRLGLDDPIDYEFRGVLPKA